LESVGTLASGIAHDFNNLLGAMVAQAELALTQLAAGSSPEGELGAIRDVAMRGSEIVRELMIYAGKEAEVCGRVDVSQVVEQILELLKVSVSKHATLKTNLGDHLPAIAATAAQISQLVMNLATNASEAIGDRNGMILVTTRRVTVGRRSGEIERLAEGEYVQLEVSDTGCGMSPETRAKVFDPFFSTKSAGRGLGLAVVHGIVRSLGGAINLASEPGHGTTFQILLPCAESTSGAVRGTISEIGQPGGTSQAATVLIVEDEDPLREAVSKMLDRHGFSIIEARDGSAALDAIREQNDPIHVLFLDITLPGATGREVLQEARRLRPAMRVIVTSAYTEEMAGASLQSTIEHFIRKPYRLDHLLHLIRPNAS
jgi:CheY-like chemotaxis protein/two-component sensor histidine kinase